MSSSSVVLVIRMRPGVRQWRQESIPGGLRVRNPERNAEVVGLLYDVSTDACAQRVHLAPFTSPPCTTPRAHGNRPERK